MTGVPEVSLAAEAGLRYAAISLVVNPATGVGDSTEPITMADIDQVLKDSATTVIAILDELVHTRATFPDDDSCADLAPAMESIGAHWEQGFRTFCIKPSQFIDDQAEMPAFCRDVVRRASQVA